MPLHQAEKGQGLPLIDGGCTHCRAGPPEPPPPGGCRATARPRPRARYKKPRFRFRKTGNVAHTQRMKCPGRGTPTDPSGNLRRPPEIPFVWNFGGRHVPALIRPVMPSSGITQEICVPRKRGAQSISARRTSATRGPTTDRTPERLASPKHHSSSQFPKSAARAILRAESVCRHRWSTYAWASCGSLCC